jgi:DNA-binding FadR family transcriptional regulator
VLTALAKRDSELARKAMSEHLAAGAAPLINHLVEHGVVEPGDGSAGQARG